MFTTSPNSIMANKIKFQQNISELLFDVKLNF